MPAEAALDEPLRERRRLTNLAFRMLGSWNDAEDVVQQTYERWYRLGPAQRDAIERPGAWLTTAASRISLNVLDSARVRRERYVGPWLPEPVPTSSLAGERSGVAHSAGGADPLDRIELDDTVSMALLIVLESLTAAERVVFVLHEVFAMPFPEIAEIVDRSPAATRQLATSARRRVRELQRTPVPAAEHTRLVSAFRAACEAGDLDALIAVLDPAVVTTSDGGGKVNAARRPVVGADQVARFLLGILAKRTDVSVEERSINGQTGFAVVDEDGGVEGVLLVDGRPAEPGEPARIDRIWIVMNPEKLRAFA